MLLRAGTHEGPRHKWQALCSRAGADRFPIMTRRKSIIAALVVLLLAGAGFVVYTVCHYLYVTVPNAYAVWNTASLINDYMDAHDGAWPRGWDDLRRTRP